MHVLFTQRTLCLVQNANESYHFQCYYVDEFKVSNHLELIAIGEKLQQTKRVIILAMNTFFRTPIV